MGGMNELAAWLSDPVVFWTALGVIVTLSGLVASLATTAVSALVRRRSRPEADWIADAWASEYNEFRVQVAGKFANVGDASAFNVRATTNRGTAQLGEYGPPSVSGGGTRFFNSLAAQPLLAPGASTSFILTLDKTDWEDLEVTITWITSPTRLKKELQWTWKPSGELEAPQPPPGWSQ